MMRALSLGVLVTMVFGCSPQMSWNTVRDMVEQDFPDVDHVSVEELHESLEDEGLVLLDVREANEYAVSHLPGAKRAQPGSDAADLVEGLDPDTPIVAYCSVGYRSSQLVEKLKAKGFTNVRNLDGSIFEWANGGYPVERDGEAVREVHPYDEKWGVLLNEELRAYEPRSK